MYVDPISAALSVLSGEDRGLISRTAAGNRAFPSDDVSAWVNIMISIMT